MQNKQAYKQPEDKWFEKNKLAPPERTAHMTEEEVERKMERFRQNHQCSWRQQGNLIYCTTGEYEHGQRIPTSKRLTGTDDYGRPLLVNVV